MKYTLSLWCLFLIQTQVVWGEIIPPDKLQVVNKVLGDKSFTETFGVTPSKKTDEILRLQTHLAFVEGYLRHKNVSHLSPELQQRRLLMLDLLHEYWKQAHFPKNEQYPGERRPCFIDASGAICAVGYLIEQTADRNLAECINAKHQFDYIQDMTLKELCDWVNTSGLTSEECAMIQPSYGPPQLDKNFKILKITPTTANISTNMMDVDLEVVGLPDYYYGWRSTKIPSLSFLNICLVQNSKNVALFRIKNYYLSTTGTLPVRWNGSISVQLPVKNQTAGTYSIYLEAYQAFNDIWFSQSTTFTIKSTTTNVEVSQDNSQISVFPNPVSELLHLEGLESEPPFFRLFLPLGYEIPVVVERQNYRQHTLNMNTLPRGVYYLEITDKKRRIIKNVIKL